MGKIDMRYRFYNKYGILIDGFDVFESAEAFNFTKQYEQVSEEIFVEPGILVEQGFII